VNISEMEIFKMLDKLKPTASGHIYSVFVTQNHKYIRNTLAILLAKCCCRNM